MVETSYLVNNSPLGIVRSFQLETSDRAKGRDPRLRSLLLSRVFTPLTLEDTKKQVIRVALWEILLEHVSPLQNFNGLRLKLSRVFSSLPSRQGVFLLLAFGFRGHHIIHELHPGNPLLLGGARFLQDDLWMRRVYLHVKLP